MMICALVIVTMVHVQAQGPRQANREVNPEKIAERMTQRMDEQLDLTEAQEKEINALFVEQANKRKAIEQAVREEMKAEREAHQQKLEAILTPEQKEKWESVRNEGRQKMRERRGGNQGRPRGNNG